MVKSEWSESKGSILKRELQDFYEKKNRSILKAHTKMISNQLIVLTHLDPPSNFEKFRLPHFSTPLMVYR